MIAGRMFTQQGDLSFQLRATWRGHSEQIRDLAFSPDDATLAAACLDGTVWVWDTARLVLRHTLADTEHPRPLFGRTPLPRLSFSPDGALLAASIGNGRIAVYDERGKVARLLSEGGWQPTDAMFTSSGEHLVTADRVGEVRIWDTSSWRVVQRFIGLSSSDEQGQPFSGQALPIRHLSLAPDQHFLVLVVDAEPGSLLAFKLSGDLSPTEPPSAALEHGYALSMPAFSPDSSLLCVADPLDDCAHIVNVRSCHLETSCCPDHDTPVAARFICDGHLLAVAGGQRGIVWIWDMLASQFVGGIPAHTEGWGEGSPAWKIGALAISTAGGMLATAGMDYPAGLSAKEPYTGPVDWTIKLWTILWM